MVFSGTMTRRSFTFPTEGDNLSPVDPTALELLRFLCYQPLPQTLDDLRECVPSIVGDLVQARLHLESLVDRGWVSYAGALYPQITNNPGLPQYERCFYPTVTGALYIREDRDRRAGTTPRPT